MTQDELDELASQTLHIDVLELRDSDLTPVECRCGSKNCHGWRLVGQQSDTHDGDTVSNSEIFSTACCTCRGDAYRVITRGRAMNLPVEFVLCTKCAALGVLQDGVMLPVSIDLGDMLSHNYHEDYKAVKDLQQVARRLLMSSKWMWN